MARARKPQEERPADRRRRRTVRIVLAVVLGLALYYALFGGEYSVFELRSLSKRVAQEQARLDSLRIEVDSLESRADSLENDSRSEERIARERYGMIRPGERLYCFVQPDSAAQDSVELADAES